MVESSAQRKRPGFTTVILVSIIFGVACGLFFGESIDWVKSIGDAFVGLLQMAVLPYVSISLIANFGRLSLSRGARLLRVSTAVLMVLWGVGVIALLIMTQSFPDWETGSFFSSRFTEEPPLHDWQQLFIPANPFRALANNSIPAVVVFSMGLGIALMTVPNKSRLLEPLDIALDALSELNKLVVKLTPVGMFAIVAHTAGTIHLNQFSLIQGYLLTYCVATLILSLLVLPILVSAVTPFSYRDVTRASRDPLIAAFVIGNTFVVLPMIVDAVNRLQQEAGIVVDGESQPPEYLVPLAYPFPDIGRIVGLIFIPFAAWFYGSTIDLEQYPGLMGVGILGSFGKPVITIPLLLDIAELPSDIFNLFLASGVVAARFGDLVKTTHLIAFTILVSCIIGRTARFKWRKIIVGLVVSVGLLLLAAMLIRAYLNASFKNVYSREKLVTEREMEFPHSRPMSRIEPMVLSESAPNPTPILAGETRIDRIKKTGTIRVGFDEDKIPFAYQNSVGQLIGFDIEMAYFLADDLQVNIEFVPMDRQNLDRQLREDHFDIAMSAVEGTLEQAAVLPSIDPYMDVTLAIVVPDHRKREFRDLDEVREIPDLKLAVIKGTFFAERARKVLPGNRNVEIVELDTAGEYFGGRFQAVDGLVVSAESGSAWTLRYPKFAVANPLKGRIRVPLYYLTTSDPEFEKFLQNWLTLKRFDGTYDQLYDHWILGLDKKNTQPRWSILHDVLGWPR